MENEIKISVICLAYNHEKYIRKCLDGFVMQKTNFKYEVLINDDCSTDNTAQIIREYEEKYPDIIKPIYQTENQHSKGVKITRQILLPLAKGKYVAFCEGDDYWCDESKLQTQFDAMEANPNCKMCVHKVLRISEDGAPTQITYPRFQQKTGVINGEDFIYKTIIYSFQTSSYVFNAEAFKNLFQDTPEFARIAPVGDECYVLYFGSIGDVYYIDKVMSCYRNWSIGSWSSRHRADNKKNIDAIYKIIRMFEEFNKYSSYAYNTAIQKRINKRRIRALFLERNYKAILKKDLREEFLQLKRKERLCVYLYAYFPWLMKMLKK